MKYLIKNMKNKEKIKVSPYYNILEALKLMDKLSCKLLIVMNGNKFMSVLSIGDIQRAIINKVPLDTKIEKILRKDISISSNNDSITTIKDRIFDLRSECMPVVDKEDNLVKLYFWEDFFPNSNKDEKKKVDLPVVIMAGGKGERLKPLTNVLPKPLIPIGDKTIIEEIMSRFITIGSKKFYISLFHKSELIKYYFKEKKNNEYKIHFFEEDKPLGTAGSLSLLKKKLIKPFFVTNCDIVIDQDYREIYKYHKENNNEITIVSALNHFKSPYGIIETGKDGKLISITEKPEITYNINSGMYILEPHLINEIPENKFYHITELIKKIKNRNGKVGVFPVSQKSWIDIGDWKKYIDEIKVI
jgi:dTDP-glucose pyrophosphorylase